MFSVTVIVCAYPARKLHNFHIQSPTPASQYRTTSVPAHPAGTPTQPFPRATIIAGNVAQRCRAALTGNGMGHKCRPRVPDGTHGLREGAKTSPKGAGRHSRATGRDINVAQGYRAALTGNRKGLKRRPRVSPGTHGQREGAETSPKDVARHSRATGRDINVAQGCRTVLTGNRKGHKRSPRVPDGTHGQRDGT